MPASSPAARPGIEGREVVLADLTVAFDRAPAIHHLSGKFAAGTLTALVGPNGAGKTTLLRTIAGLLRPVEGSVTITPPAAVAYLAQRAELDASFPIDVAGLVLTGLWRRVGWGAGVDAAMRRQAAAAIAAVGLAGLERRAIGALSLGQLQRALFARLIVEDAPVVLLDEPFAGVDAATTADLLAIVEGWHREGRTVIAALHDIEQVLRHFPETLVLARKAVAWGPSRTALAEAGLVRAVAAQA